MMSWSSDRQLRTGSDPRTLADYVLLREELSKLSHPARPDVDWHKVEQLCLNLFQQNGIELQTAAWFTSARCQLAGLQGLSEGLAVVDSLVTYQWSRLWPQPVHARMEILNGLSQRTQHRLRSITLCYADLAQIYQVEKYLDNLCEVLQRLELKHVSQLGELRLFMHNAAVRLENRDASELETAGIVLSTRAAVENAPSVSQPWVYVAQAEPQSPRVVIEPLAKRQIPWKGFIAGVLTTAIVGTLAGWGWIAFHKDMVRETILASAAPLPQALTPLVQEQLHATHAEELDQQASALIDVIQQQTHRVSQLSPLWRLDYGSQLVNQAQTLWPKNPAAENLAQQWRQKQKGNALPLDSLPGWHQANAQLQQLANRLNGLDEQHGKYMTVSELKSVVFSLTQSLHQSVPLEEQLYLLSQTSAGSPPPDALVQQTDTHFTQLLYRYALIKQTLAGR